MRLHPFFRFVAMASICFLYVPLFAVAVFSVNASRFGLSWKGFTLDWYVQLAGNSVVLEATRNTVFLALVSTAVSTVLGTALAIGLKRHPWGRRWSGFFDVVLHLPVVTPEIVFAAALVIAFALLRYVSSVFDPGMLNMIIGHITFQIAFVAMVVGSRLSAISPKIEEAARDLYADNAFLLRHVTLPLLRPGIVAGAMLAFTMSLDDFVISFFTAGPSSMTLPLYIYAQVRRGVTPDTHALSTLILLITVLGVIVIERFSRTSTKEKNHA